MEHYGDGTLQIQYTEWTNKQNELEVCMKLQGYSSIAVTEKRVLRQSKLSTNTKFFLTGSV